MTDAPRPSGLPRERIDARTGFRLSALLSSGLSGGSAIALGTPGQRPIADTEPLGSFGGRRLPRGLVIASDGRIYFADAERRVILTALASDAAAPRPPGAAAEWPFVPLWPARPLPVALPQDVAPAENPPADPYTLVQPLALALAPNGDLVIVDAGRKDAGKNDAGGRVIVLTLPGGRIRHVLRLVAPVAISFDALGRACIADAGAETIARFDRAWRREADYPHRSVPPIAGLEHLAHARGAPCACGCGGTCGCASGCDAPGAPTPDLWIIAQGRVHALTRDGFLWSNGALAFPGTGTIPAAALRDDDRLMPPPLDHGADGTLTWRDPAYPARDPLALPGFVVDRGGHLAGSAIALLARPRRIALPRSGVAQLLALDGDREGFVWDRIALAAEIPERTRVLVSTATTDAALEERLVKDLPASAWSAPLEIGAGAVPEILVQSTGGRYLWLRIEMFGDGTLTPRIAGIDLFGPRTSSLADMPPVYREDPESAAFLDRFLSYFDTVFAEIAAAHARVPALFDPQAVPARDFLDWLASWFDITFLPEWPEATRRAMVAKAIEMYRRRGTVAGLRQMLQWHTGLGEPAPAVIEHFRITSPISIAGSPLAPASPAHAFTIVLPAVAAPDASARARLDRVIEAAIPAHTRYELRLIAPGIALGRQSTPGIDMLIGSTRPRPFGEAELGTAMFPGIYPPLRLVTGQGEPCSC
jgi:phage tail-like protein